MRFLTIWDITLLPVYLIIIYFVATQIKKRRIDKNPEYKYYVKGLFAKIIGGLGVCIIYSFYYGGGDTIGYSEGSTYMSRLMTHDFGCWFRIMLDQRTIPNWMCFDPDITGQPYYFWDGKSFAVIRFTNLLSTIGFRSFMITTVLVATVTFPGMWRLFQMFYREFPNVSKSLAISVLFVPSVCFWGSAILKDAYTMSAAAWLVYGIFYLFFKQDIRELNMRRVAYFLIVIAISIFVLISLKPYIFISVFIGVLLMLTHRGVRKLRSPFLKFFFLPFILVVIWGSGYLIFNQLTEAIGETYSSLDNMLEKAVVTQQDLKTSVRYGQNYFDIGDFDPTIGGILSKTPQAMAAGLFRPFLWECNNPVMFISGFENFLMIIGSVYILILIIMAWVKLGIRHMTNVAFDHSLIVFSLIFSLTFAFFVGLTTANFGALVRYKIPLMPFLLAAIFVIIDRFNTSKMEKFEKTFH